MGKRRSNKRSNRRGGFAGYEKTKPAHQNPNLFSHENNNPKKRKYSNRQVSSEQIDSVAIEIFGPDRTYHGNLSSN